MTELLTSPPPPDAIAAMLAIPGLDIAPSILVAQEGPAADLGPEGAGAILVLQATFADPEGQAGFFGAAVPLMALLAGRAGDDPPLQLPGRADDHAHRLVAHDRGCAGVRRVTRAPRRGARPLPPPLAVHPLLRLVGDDLEPWPARVLPVV